MNGPRIRGIYLQPRRMMMRQIEVSANVFSIIWKARIDGEENEDQILLRLLTDSDLYIPKSQTKKQPRNTILNQKNDDGDLKITGNHRRKIRWVDDIYETLQNLGGTARLSKIYYEVVKVRKTAGRSVPKAVNGTIRRTLEDHCRASANFRGVELFEMPEGHGAGLWAIKR